MPAWPKSSVGLTPSVQVGLLATIAALHLVQLGSPLRLNTDAVVYLSLGHAAAQDAAWTFAGQPPHFPPGYPLLLFGLERLGILQPAALVALNLLSVGAALASAHRLLRQGHGLDGTLAGAAVLCTLSSWVLVKHVALPLSDAPYLGLSLLALAALERVGRAGGAGLAAVAIGLVLLAASVRYVGLALFPAAAWALLERRPPARGSRGLLLAALAAALALAALLGALTFAGQALAFLRGGGPASLARTLGEYRLTECGELLLNLPLSRLESARYVLFPACGLAALVLLVRGRSAGGRLRVCDVYLLGYLGMLGAWPHYEPRLWLPVLPFFYAWLLSGLAGLPDAARPWARLWACAFGALGLAALAFSVRLTLAGPRFPDEFGNGSLRTVYRVAWGQQAAPAQLDAVESAALEALRRIEPRARRGGRP